MRRLFACVFAVALVTAARGADPVVITGHKARVNAVAFTTDGKLVATASADKTVRLWDAKTGKQKLAIEEHGGPVTGLAFSADGKKLVTGGHGPKPSGTEAQAGEVKVWEVPDGKLLKAMAEVDVPVEAVAFDPNNRRVAVATGKGAHIWDVASGARKVTFEKAGAVCGLGFDAQGARLVTAGEDGTVRAWHPDTGKPVHALKGHQGLALAVAVAPNGARAVSGGQDHSVRVWNLEAGKEERKLTSHLGPVMSVAVAPDGKTCATASPLDGTVRVWEVETGKETRLLRLPKEARGPYRVAFAPDGKRLAVAGFDHSVRVYDLTAE